jgi:uncharacterized protein (TIGR02588 family)
VSKRPARSTAEWTTFAASAVIIAGIAALIAVSAAQHRDPAQPVATIVGEPVAVGGRFHVAVTVENLGDRTAEAVQVIASADIGAERIESDQVVDFLAGGDAEDLVFVFDGDPGDTAAATVAGFTVP